MKTMQLFSVRRTPQEGATVSRTLLSGFGVALGANASYVDTQYILSSRSSIGIAPTNAVATMERCQFA